MQWSRRGSCFRMRLSAFSFLACWLPGVVSLRLGITLTPTGLGATPVLPPGPGKPRSQTQAHQQGNKEEKPGPRHLQHARRQDGGNVCIVFTHRNSFLTRLYPILTFLNHIFTNCSLSQGGKGFNGTLVLRLLVPKALRLWVASTSEIVRGLD